MILRAAYMCGPTVHNHQHVGNYKTFFQSIEHFKAIKKKGDLMLVNITDIGSAVYEGTDLDCEKVLKKVNYYTRSFVHLLRVLGLKPWTLDFQRTSQHVKLMKKDLKILLKNGCVAKKEDGLILEPQGFYLWRVNQDIAYFKGVDLGFNEKGIPGWHNECATLIHHYCRPKIIHYGGIDLKDLHHKNQQTILSHLSNPQVEFFHSGSLLVENEGKIEKISKSKNNIPFSMDTIRFNPKGIQTIKSFYRRCSFKNPVVLKKSFVNKISQYRTKVDLRKRDPLIGVVFRRLACKKKKNFKGADLLRSTLAKYNYCVTDRDCEKPTVEKIKWHT